MLLWQKKINFVAVTEEYSPQIFVSSSWKHHVHNGITDFFKDEILFSGSIIPTKIKSPSVVQELLGLPF